jgi:hypothetical protein
VLVVDVVDDESVPVFTVNSDQDGFDGRVALDEDACGSVRLIDCLVGWDEGFAHLALREACWLDGGCVMGGGGGGGEVR